MQTRPTVRALFDDMTPQDMRDWLRVKHAWLARKIARERAYLDRRARRGTFTPTDEAYEDDQQQERDLLAFLAEMQQAVVRAGGIMP
ncbi:MAG TPA: hypothetical protein VNG51_01315 [Ktedonobacteraceae bacterium]|nr:hypothetical protein [Ktedonobacteraceae bacterium]